jgi:hypothetical protein
MNGSGFVGVAKLQVTWFFITKRSQAFLVGGSLGRLVHSGSRLHQAGRARLEPATVEM